MSSSTSNQKTGTDGKIEVDIEKIQNEIRAAITRRPDYGTFDKQGTSFMRTTLSEEAAMVAGLRNMAVMSNQSWNIIPMTTAGGGNRRIARLTKRLFLKVFGWPARRYFRIQTDCNGHIIREQNEMINLMQKLTTRIEAQNEKIVAQESEITDLSGMLRRYLAEYESRGRSIHDRLDECEKNIQQTETLLKAGLQEELPADFDYTGFEDRYRGSEESVLERQKDRYLGFFSGRHHVADLGCGRGEFLSILKEAGVEAIGVDLDEKMIERCQEKGLQAVKASADDYILDAESGSFDGIMCAQVVEHISPAALLRLAKGCYAALEEGGLLAIETINPLSLSTYRFAYPMDPTHRHMVHPFTLQYLLQSVGFSKVDLCYFSPAREMIRIPTDTPEEMAAFYKDINDCLFGEQDYAVIAVR